MATRPVALHLVSRICRIDFQTAISPESIQVGCDLNQSGSSSGDYKGHRIKLYIENMVGSVLKLGEIRKNLLISS
ncbi:MAG: hypothetical protein WCB71_06190, partial [Aestuariivirga sp.]